MQEDYAKRKALLIQLFRAFPSSQAGLTEGNIDAYARAIADMSIEALERSVGQFSRGLVERNNAFAPSAPELAENVRAWDLALSKLNSPDQIMHHGVMKLDFGGITGLDMRGTTVDELEFAIKNKRLPEPGELTAIDGPARVVTPKLARME